MILTTAANSLFAIPYDLRSKTCKCLQINGLKYTRPRISSYGNMLKLLEHFSQKVDTGFVKRKRGNKGIERGFDSIKA